MRTLLPLLMLVAACAGKDDADGVDTDTDPPVVPDSFHDPLSMPESPTLDMASFTSAQECVVCHATHVEEWSSSNHAYAMVDPVYRAIVGVRQADYDGEQDQFCTQCHSAIGTRGGDIVDGFSFDDLQPITLEGITCEACHKVEALERPYNSGHVIDEDGPIRGPIEDPSPNAFHDSVYSELHTTSDFCAGCHDVVEVSGLNLERPFEEWQESPAAGEGKPCQACHMPTYTGQAADGAPERELHSHRFIGVDIPLLDGFVDAETEALVRDEVKALLASAASMTLTSPAESRQDGQLDLVVTITNEIDAHAFPTGSTNNRQVWLELVARDGDGAVLFETGTLDTQGDLKNFWSETEAFGDEDLIMLSSSLTNSLGDPELFSWRAIEHTTAAVSPLYPRTYTLFVPRSESTPGPITVEARLLFRQLPPYLLRALDLGELVPKLEIHEVATASLVVPLE